MLILPQRASDRNVYQAPTVELEDKIFAVGTTADAAKFERVKEELGKHFATHPRSDGSDAAMVRFLQNHQMMSRKSKISQ